MLTFGEFRRNLFFSAFYFDRTAEDMKGKQLKSVLRNHSVFDTVLKLAIDKLHFSRD